MQLFYSANMAYITSIMADFIFNISTKIADLADNIRKTPKSIDWHMLCNVERAPKIKPRWKRHLSVWKIFKDMYIIFISHSWSYFKQYDKVEEFLQQEKVPFLNHSVPKNDPIHTTGTDEELEVAIESKIKRCSCVIILAGVYVYYSKWIKKEIKMAQKYGKPIIAVKYWGAERTSKVVKDAADVIVNWNAKSIAKAVRDYA